MRKYGWLVWNQNHAWRLFLPKSSGSFTQNRIAFGSNRKSIPVTHHPLQPGEFGFPVHLRKSDSGIWRLPPLIGIITSEHAHPPGFRGNKANFRDIIETGRRSGFVGFVFTPSGLNERDPHISGYTRHPAVKQWIRTVMPLPNVVYNRIPDREAEQRSAEQKTLQFFNTNPDTHLFNPQFFDKQQLFRWFKRDHTLSAHLPETEIWGSKSTLTHFLYRYNTLYVKPAQGKAGKGVMQIKKRADDYLLTFVTGKGHELKRYRTRFSHHLYQKINSLTKGQPYMLQQGITLARYHGRPFDLRQLVQKDGDGQWRVTGLGIRVAGAQGITTHVPRGGSIGNPSDIFPHAFGSHAKRMYNRSLELAILTAKGIERQSRLTLGEMSIDLGIDQNRQLWLFEANAKPMKFDEPLIRKRSLERIIEYAVYLAEGRERVGHP